MPINEGESEAPVPMEESKVDETPSETKPVNKSSKTAEKKEEEFSEEDLALKEGLELAVTRLQENDISLHKQALDHLATEIKTSTSSMTSVPKPLKFLRPHYDVLKGIFLSWPITHEMKIQMADVVSVLAMTMAPRGSRESLKFKLQGTQVDLSSWGHEYVRSMSGEISEEYNFRQMSALAEEDAEVDDLITLVDDIVPFQMSHNAEADAIDLLLEIQQLNKLVETNVVDARNFERVCLYLIRSADYMSDPDDVRMLLETAFTLYKTQQQFPNALRIALKLDNGTSQIEELFAEDSNASELVKKQMCLILARHRSPFTVSDNDSFNEIIGNTTLSEQFLSAARDMDMLEPKIPEDIYKTASSKKGGAAQDAQATDSARGNLAASFVNAFVNAGFNKDKLMTEDGNNWVFKNKDHGMLSATASLGMVLLWNVDEGLNQIDKYFHHSDDYVKAGACLGVGILSSGVRNEADPALAILSDYLENKSHNIRLASISGLGIAYAGSQREELMELLVPIVANTDAANMAEVSMAALSLGMVYVGTCNEEIASIIVQRLMESNDAELGHTMSRFLCLGLGLLYLGRSEQAEATLEAVRCVEHATGRFAAIVLETCAYAGTGNVLKVQEMLRICTEHLTEGAQHQAAAVLGIALITVGEDIGTDMTLRTFEHLLHYAELPVKRVVPLALALLYVSNPDYVIIDQLSRLSHDQDAELSQCAILGLGIVSAGSNNSRVSGLLRQLSEFYAKEANHLFLVRIAQGLNALSKGLNGISPFQSDRLLMNGPAMAGILTVLHASLDLKNTLLDKYHFLLYHIAAAINPRFLTAVDSDMKPVTISVRVGQAVETVGQAGKPRTISGFQTHTTPVLLGTKDRAELANKDYTCLAGVLENVIIVEKAEVKEDIEKTAH